MNLLEQAEPQTLEYRKIPLTQSQFALVDAGDYLWLSQWKWFAYWHPRAKTFYARRNLKINGVPHMIGMHRIIVNAPTGVMVDHANHIGFDNRRFNLRLCKPFQNSSNARKIKPSVAGLKGVSIKKGRFLARITHLGRVLEIGTFPTAQEAHAAYVYAAIRLRGEFACSG